MAGLVPATHVLVQRQRQVFSQRDGVDGRDKHGHDGGVRARGRRDRLFERIRSEFAYFNGLRRALARTRPIGKNPTHTFCDVAEEMAARCGDRIALISDRESFSYREWNGRANRYARWAKSQGLGKGDVVALLMPNRPEYL